MRNKVDLAPNKNKARKTSGSNKFVSAFKSGEIYGGAIEKSSSHSWKGYIQALKFTILIGILTGGILLLYTYCF